MENQPYFNLSNGQQAILIAVFVILFAIAYMAFFLIFNDDINGYPEEDEDVILTRQGVEKPEVKEVDNV